MMDLKYLLLRAGTSLRSKTPRRSVRATPLAVEALEERRLLSAFAASIAGDDLVGTNATYTLLLRTTQPTSKPWTIHWGDGSSSAVAGSATSVTHAYANTGNYAITGQVRDASGTLQNAFLDYQSAVLDDAPAAYFRLDETSGTTATDQVAGAPNGVLVGTTSLGNAAASANLGSALKLGGGGYLSVPASFGQTGDAFSLECWLRPNDLTSTQTLYAGTGTAAGNVHVYTSGTTLDFQLVGTGTLSYNFGTLITTGTWHQVAVSYDRLAKEVRFYVDGLVRSSSSFAGTPGGVSYTGAAIGAWNQGGGTVTQYERGQLDEVAVYGGVLTPARLRDHDNDALTPAAQQWVTVGVTGAQPFTVAAPVTTQTVTVPLNPDPAADNGPAIRAALASAAPGTVVRLVDQVTGLGGGTYTLRSGVFRSGQKDFLQILNTHNILLDGNGVTLFLTGTPGTYLDVYNVQQVTVENLNFDLDPSYARAGAYARILSINPSTRAVALRAVNGRTGAADVLPAGTPLTAWEAMDPATFGKLAGPDFDNTEYQSAPVQDATDPSIWHLTLNLAATDPFWSQLQSYQAGTNFFRVKCADYRFIGVTLAEASNVTFDHVRFYSVPGMAFLSTLVDHVQVTNCQLIPPPGETAADRPLVTGSDGFHFHNTHGDILFANNEVSLTGDDPISLKDASSTGLTRTGPTTLTIAQPGAPFHVGDPVELRGPALFPLSYHSTVTAVSIDPTTGQVTLTLQDPLPATVPPGCVLFNHSYNTSNWYVCDNYFHDLDGRLMLYAPNGSLEDNRFDRGPGRVHVGTSAVYWEDAGYGVWNLLVRGNLFHNAGADAVAYLTGGVVTSYAVFHDILFRDNSFVNAPGQAIIVSSAARVSISDNYIENCDTALNSPGLGMLPYGATIELQEVVGCWLGNNVRNQWLISPNTDITQFGIVSDGTPYKAVNNTVVARHWPLPSPWTQADVGAVGVTGGALNDNGTFAVKGSGAGIGSTADACHFVYRTWSGDGEIVARIASIEDVNAWTKVGLMIRETLASGSPNVTVELTDENGLAFQFRKQRNGATTFTPGSAATFPYWLKLVRSGNTYSGYASPDGVTWTLLGSTSFSMPRNVFIGLAVSSHANAALCYGLFDNVSVSGSTSAPVRPGSAGDGSGASAGTGTGAAAAVASTTPTFSPIAAVASATKVPPGSATDRGIALLPTSEASAKVFRETSALARVARQAPTDAVFSEELEASWLPLRGPRGVFFSSPR
jgi:hypothetical protein